MKLRYDMLRLQRREPFVSNKGNVSLVHQFLITLEWQGRTGVGTAVLAPEYGMVAETVQAALVRCAPLLRGSTPFQLEQVLNRIEDAVADQPTVVAAIDMALHDLLGQSAGMPLHRLLGLDGLSLAPTSLSLGVLPAEQLIARACQRADWPILKLKMTAAIDLEVVSRVRAVYAGRIWVDGNGAWEPDQAIEAAEILSRYGVELLEQPIPSGTPERLRLVRERSPLPIVADEDCRGPQDVLRLQGCADVINIKLLKCGGLRRALDMIRLAHRLGLRVMLGCKTETVAGITAMAQLAGLADYLDLDGHLDLLDDPYTGIAVDHGRITLPEGAGLGVAPRQPDAA